MKHILIITGGHLNIEFAKEYVKTLSYDKVFVVDKGLEYADALNLIPDYIVGDFDTVDVQLLEHYRNKIQKDEINAYIEQHPVKKDATDTELALQHAMKENAKQITILGATGSRIDHVLMNLGLLLQTTKKGILCTIIDENNRIRLLSAKGNNVCKIKREKQYGTYVSLIPMTPVVGGVSLEGVMYPLESAKIYQGDSLTVSNQITESEAVIRIEEGELLVVESKD